MPPTEFSVFTFSTAETLKNYVKVFIMPQLYIHENLVRIKPLVHKILCTQESAKPTPTPKQHHANPDVNGLFTKNKMFPSPKVGGHNIICLLSADRRISSVCP